MRTKIFFFILIFASFGAAQITLRGGVNYNYVTAGGFNRLGYEESPLFSGYYFGFGLPIALDDIMLTIGFDYASASANIKYESTGAATKLNFWNVPFYALIQMEVASPSSTFAQPFGCPFTQLSPPSVQQPSDISETFRFVLPSFLYCIVTLIFISKLRKDKKKK